MKLAISRDLLLKAVSLVVEAADSRHRLVILANLKLVVESQRLILTASDLEVELTSCVNLPQEACLQTGAITLPAEKFFSICKLLPESVVMIDASDGSNRCHISSGKSKYTLSTLPADDFPSIGKPSSEQIVKVGLQDLFGVIKHTRFAMATQDVRHYLTGLLLEISEHNLTAVATDGHRLAVAYRVLGESYPDTKVIVPGKAVAGLEKLLLDLLKVSGQDGVVSLGLDEEFLHVVLAFGNEMTIHLTARLIEGKFPDYRRVMPVGYDKIAVFNKDEMVAVLRRTSVVNTKESPGVLLGFDKADVATVSSNNREQDEVVESLAVQYTGEPIEVSFNEAYLRAVLNVLEADIRLEMVHPNSPTLIYQLGDEQNHQYIVMPMRV
ncbi:MAG: DNA polymerase III subunit beta [Moraxella sp.]|nr:DNA polymerase III subunit beta [Moraxella sp.]